MIPACPTLGRPGTIMRFAREGKRSEARFRPDLCPCRHRPPTATLSSFRGDAPASSPESISPMRLAFGHSRKSKTRQVRRSPYLPRMPQAASAGSPRIRQAASAGSHGFRAHRCAMSRNDDQEARVRIPATWSARGLLSAIALKQRAQGRPGASARTRSLVCKGRKKNAHKIITGTPKHRPSLRNGLRLTPRSPRGAGFLAPVVGRNTCFAQLDPSIGGPGPHGFAVRSGLAFVLRAPPRPSHPASNVRDDREAPLLRVQDATKKARFLIFVNKNIFDPRAGQPKSA
jgi:hypothetical protein